MIRNSWARNLVLVFAIGSRIASGASALVFTRVAVIDVRTGDVQPNMSVVIEGSEIRAVGKTANTPAPAGSRVVDAGGKYIAPGLWDMHTHTLRRERIDRWLPLFIANGVTGIRDMGSPLSLEIIRQLDRECQTGQRTGPRIVANGRIFGGGFLYDEAPANSPEEAKATVRELKASGADFIKVSSFLSRDVFFAVAAEAQRQGLPVVGHVPESVPIVEAAKAGMKSFEHSYGVLQACSTNRYETAHEIQSAIAGKHGAEAVGALVRTTDRLYGKQTREKTYSEQNCVQAAAALAHAGLGNARRFL
jgi:cytosine/adenosine deaminase-related metal-dependent hydrolase